ncbi:MAG: hypothetical protein M1839_009108 [Geoglossum umbratile]|nr:MAG: hypothetical protein M1839_009108 [Geoglossum umbratile]
MPLSLATCSSIPSLSNAVCAHLQKMPNQVLPADWKLDYDTAAKQWCYIHKITSRKQYTFPRDGDELNLGSEPAPLHPVKDEPRHAEDQSLEVNMAALSVSGRETVGRRDSNAAAFRQPTPRSGTLQPTEDGAWRFVEPKGANTAPQVNEGGGNTQEQAAGLHRSDTVVSAVDTPVNEGLQVAEQESAGPTQSQTPQSSMPVSATSQQGPAEMSGNWSGQPLTTTPTSTTSPVPAQPQQPQAPPQTPFSPAPSQPTPNYTTTPSQQQQQQSYGDGLSSSPTPSPSVYSVSSAGYDPHIPQRQDSVTSISGYQSSQQSHTPLSQGYGGIPQQLQQQPPPQQQYNTPPPGFYAPQQPYPQQGVNITPQQQYQQYPSAPPAASPYYPPQSAPASTHSYGSSVHKSRFDSLFPKNKSALPPPASRRPPMMRPPFQYQQAMRPAEVQTMGNITINHYSLAPSGGLTPQHQPPPPPQPPQPQWYPPPAQVPHYQQAPSQQPQQQLQHQYPIYQPPPTPQQSPPMPPGTVPSPPQYVQPQPIHPPPPTVPSPPSYTQQTPAPQQQIYQPPGGFQAPQYGAPQ